MRASPLRRVEMSEGQLLSPRDRQDDRASRQQFV